MSLPLSEPRPSSLRHQLFAVWCAPIFSLLTAVGWMGFAQGLFIAPASLTAEETADFFARHQDGILFGALVFAVACCFLAVWTAQMGIMIWQMEGRAPVWAITQVLMGVSIVVVVVLNCSFWMAAAYRPESILPEIIQSTNDAAWLGFLAVGWPLLSFQMIATALVALQDRRSEPLFPRWLAYASLAGSVALVTAGGCTFTKTGPFAFDGILAYFFPMSIWGTWLNVHAWYMRKGLKRQRASAADTSEPPELASFANEARGPVDERVRVDLSS